MLLLWWWWFAPRCEIFQEKADASSQEEVARDSVRDDGERGGDGEHGI